MSTTQGQETENKADKEKLPVWDINAASEAYEDEPPVYTLVPVLQTPQIDPGESVRVNIFITGAGRMNRNKMYMNFSHPEILSSEMGTITAGFKVEQEEDGKLLIVSKEDIENQSELELKLSGTGIVAIPNWMFFPLPKEIVADKAVSGVKGVPEMYAQKPTEITLGDSAPLELTIHTAEDASAGDYTLTLVFTYKSGTNIYRDEQKVQFHVNTLREEYEPIPTIIAVLAGTAAVLSLIYQTGIIGYIINVL